MSYHYCEKCPYYTDAEDLLVQHQQVHAKKPNVTISSLDNSSCLVCPHCPYKASRSDNLKIHLNAHTGENKYNCPHCSYASTRSDHLKVHVKCHTGEKPYSCPHCPYKAIQSSTLKSHIRTHTGERPYLCTHCSYSAARKDHLKIHLKKHSTNKKILECFQCNFKTSRSNLMKKHLKSHQKTDELKEELTCENEDEKIDEIGENFSSEDSPTEEEDRIGQSEIDESYIDHKTEVQQSKEFEKNSIPKDSFDFASENADEFNKIEITTPRLLPLLEEKFPEKDIIAQNAIDKYDLNNSTDLDNHEILKKILPLSDDSSSNLLPVIALEDFSKPAQPFNNEITLHNFSPIEADDGGSSTPVLPNTIEDTSLVDISHSIMSATLVNDDKNLDEDNLLGMPESIFQQTL